MKFIGGHLGGVLVALGVGLLVSLPNIVFTHTQGYKGQPMFQVADEYFYLARLNAAGRGCVVSCNPYIKEYRSLYPSFDPSISEVLLAWPITLFGISVAHLQLFYDLVLPAVATFLCYLFIWRLCRRRDLSIVGTLFIFCGYNLVNYLAPINFPEIWSLIRHFGTGTVYETFLTFARPVNPQFSSIIFFIFLHAFLSFIRTPGRKSMLVVVLVYACSFYIYFYLFAFLTAVLGGTMLVSLATKDTTVFKRTLLVLGLGLLLGSPILIELWQLVHDPLYRTVPIVPTLAQTHRPHLTFLWIMVTLVYGLILALYSKGTVIGRDMLYIISLALGSVLALNQNIFTGIVVQNFHFDVYYIAPIFIISLCCMLSRYELKPLVFGIVVLLLVCNALAVDYHSYRLAYQTSVYEGRYHSSLQWLNDHVQESSVIFSEDPSIAELIPVYTPHFVFWSVYAEGFITPEERYENMRAGETDFKAFEANMSKYHVDYAVLNATSTYSQVFSSSPVYSDTAFTIYKTSTK